MPPPHRFHSNSVLCILLSYATAASSINIWRVSIWEAPAPPPGKGPPIAVSALRDKSYLPAQISAIVAAYVFSVLVIGSAILFVGRRLRRAAQASPKSLAMEMIKPVKTNLPNSYNPSPVSPTTTARTGKSPGGLYGPSPADTIDMKNNWPSPNKLGRSSPWGSLSKGHRKQPSVRSVAASSVVTFDESVIEDDKERNQKEMERLYAAVMEHDDKKSTSVLNVADEEQQQNPPELQHLRHIQPSSSVPASSDINAPSRTSTKSPRASSKPTPLSLHSRNSSRSSFGSFGKKRGIRGLPISPPMGSADLVPDHYSIYGESEPLTPRVYDDPGPPPPTPPHTKSRQDRIGHSRLSPQDAKFPPIAFRGPRSSIPQSPTVHTIPEISNRPTLLKGESDRSVMSRDTAKTKRAPAPLALSTPGNASSSTPRQPKPSQTAPLPLRNPHPTAYNADRTSTIKATVLERKVPNSALRTPGTGVPMTPYSPYMPYTPLTPMTPSRLVTREERKRRDKEEGKRVATIDDAVEEEPDMWGEAYG